MLQHRISDDSHDSDAKLQLGLSIGGLGLGEINYVSDEITLDATAAALFALPANVAVPRGVVHSRFHPDSIVEMTAEIKEALDVSGNGSMSIEHRIVRPDGTMRWISARKKVEFSRGSVGVARRPIKGLLAVLDISDRVEAEEMVRISEIRYRRLFEAAQDGVLLLDPQTSRITDANPFMSALLGYSHDEFVGKELFEIGLLKDASASQEMVRKLRSGQQVRYEHLPLQGQFGKHQEVEVVANLYDENGHSVIQCNIRDITERKRSEETSARLVAIVDSSTDAIISKDLNGIIQSWNGGAEAIFGYTAAEVLGRSITLLIPSDRLPEEQAILEQIARGVSVPHFETVRLRKDGSAVNISVAVSVISDKSGRITGASKVARDIDQRKRGDEQKALLMAEINHRAKNLLAVVEAVARQSARSGEPGTFVARLAERIRGLAASHDLLVSSQWQGVEVCELVEAQLAHFKDLIGTRVLIQGARTRITPAAAQGIGMALHELATNAGKYGALSNAEGRVLISWQLTSSNLPTFTMGWLEEGGPMVVAPTHMGFGQKVIGRMVEAAVDGTAEIDYLSRGFSWKLSAPCAGLVEGGWVMPAASDAAP